MKNERFQKLETSGESSWSFTGRDRHDWLPWKVRRSTASRLQKVRVAQRLSYNVLEG